MHQHAAAVVLHLQPFVGIEGDRIRPLQSLQPRREGRVHHPDSADRPVDVEPAARRPRDVRQPVEVVDRPGVDRPGAADHRQRADTRRGVRVHQRAQGAEVDAERRIDRNPAHRRTAKAEKFGRLLQRPVDLTGGVDRDRPAEGGQSPPAAPAPHPAESAPPTAR